MGNPGYKARMIRAGDNTDAGYVAMAMLWPWHAIR